MNNELKLKLIIEVAAERYLKLKNENEKRSEFYNRDPAFSSLMEMIHELQVPTGISLEEVELIFEKELGKPL